METPGVTSQQLTDMLAATGRVVTLRVLTSWRSKGLLPQLRLMRRDQGAGWVQVWTEPNIFERAAILHDSLCCNRRTDYALWVLWFCGFAVSPEEIRRIWRQRLSGMKLQRQAEPGEYITDKYADDIHHLTKALQKRPELLEEYIARPIATEIIAAANERSSVARGKSEFDELYRAINHLIIDKKMLGPPIWSVTPADLAMALREFRLFVSFEANATELDAAIIDQLVRSQSCLIELGRVLLVMIKAKDFTEGQRAQLLLWRPLFAAAFGPSIFRAILRIIRAGKEDRFRRACVLLIGVFTSMESTPKSPPPISDNTKVRQEIFNILNDLWASVRYN